MYVISALQYCERWLIPLWLPQPCMVCEGWIKGVGNPHCGYALPWGVGPAPVPQVSQPPGLPINICSTSAWRRQVLLVKGFKRHLPSIPSRNQTHICMVWS